MPGSVYACSYTYNAGRGSFASVPSERQLEKVRAAARYLSSGSEAPGRSTGRSIATTLCGSRAAKTARWAGEITSYGGATTRARSGTMSRL